MSKTDKNSVETFLLRLPKALKKEMERRAKKFQRSVNRQIVYELGGPEFDKP